MLCIENVTVVADSNDLVYVYLFVPTGSSAPTKRQWNVLLPGCRKYVQTRSPEFRTNVFNAKHCIVLENERGITCNCMYYGTQCQCTCEDYEKSWYRNSKGGRGWMEFDWQHCKGKIEVPRFEAGGPRFRAEPSEDVRSPFEDLKRLGNVMISAYNGRVYNGLLNSCNVYSRPLAFLGEVILILFRCECFLLNARESD